MRFSIITVCYNAEKDIRQTIESVVNQSLEDYEYIIVDGKSSDGTMDIVREYADRYPAIRYISEADEGLYDAMNKGVQMASGQFVEFLNAGDVFYDQDVLKKVAGVCDGLKANASGKEEAYSKVILYGNIVYIHEDGREESRLYGPSCAKAIYYATGDCINHQACFASRDCFGDRQGQYDFNYKKYKICADRDWMMRKTKASVRWICMDETLVKYPLTADSVSVRDKELLRREERMCMKEHYPLMYPIYLFFDGCRNNKLLAGLLHSVYKLLYIRKK